MKSNEQYTEEHLVKELDNLDNTAWATHATAKGAILQCKLLWNILQSQNRIESKLDKLITNLQPKVEMDEKK